MKKEIKEMLELFGSTDENIMFGDIVELNSKQSHLLLDYITNLQEENQRLKEIVENLTTMTASGDRKQIKNTAQYKLEIAQDRIDKATKELEKLLPLCIMPNNTLIHATEKSKVIEETIKILKGSDE